MTFEQERDLYDALDSFKKGIELLASENDALKGLIEAQTTRIERLESVLFDQILEPAKEFALAREDELAFSDFKERNGAALEPYGAQLAAIEGDGFDVNREAYKGWKEYRDGNVDAQGNALAGAATEEQYVAALVDTIDKQVGQIKDALGVPKDADVAVVSEDGGKPEILVDGEPVGEAVSVADADAEPFDSPEEVQAFEEELLQSLGNGGNGGADKKDEK